MSLESWWRGEIPELTRRVAGAAFPKGSLAIRLRDTLGQVFDDALFTEAFPSDGRPAASPGVLALVSVMQFAEGLSDRQAAEAVRARIDWKYLMGLELEDSGFDHSLLARFRTRLIAHGLEERVLEAVLQAALARGLLRQRGRKRTDSTRLITDVATTSAAEGDDSQALPAVHTRLGKRELLPSEQLVDSGYVTASTLVAARQEHAIDLVGPARPIVRGDGQERFGHDDFQIDDERRLAVCPAGQTSASWASTHSSRRTRVPLVQIRFDAATCRDCPLRPRCTTASNGKWGRALTLREPAQRAALQQRRREQTTDAWRARYRPRAGIESTICQIVHRTHSRRSRYRNAAATHLGHCLAATAVNLIRIDSWHQGHRPEATRTTHLCRLLTHTSK